MIGGGIAGYSAAIAARRDGAEVTVVARAPGATALYAGGMEIVDDIDGILRVPVRALHLELPRVARGEWREPYTAILAEFLAQAAALPAGR